MITVLLSVFNGEEWLEDCIKSILNQTYKHFEFLIIDDGSTDNSLSIIQKYALIDKRIKYLMQDNIGLTASLNKGLTLAQGEWIARIDSDDISLPRRLELQLKYVTDKKVSLVGCQSRIIDSNGNIKNKILVPTNYEKIYLNLKKQKKFFSHSSVLFNKKLILKLGGYRKIMKKSQDYDLWLRVSEVSNIGCISYIGNYLRQHNNRISYNDNGIEQRIYAHCANISHILRINYGLNSDPLNEMYSYKFDYFIKFVTENLEACGILIFYKKLYEFKNKTENLSSLIKFFLIPIYFKNINLILKLFMWITKGDCISELIAKKWLKLKINKPN